MTVAPTPYPVPRQNIQRFSSQYTSDFVNYAWCRMNSYRERTDLRRDLIGKLWRVSGTIIVEDDQDDTTRVWAAFRRLPVQGEPNFEAQIRAGNREFEEGSCIETAESEAANLGGWEDLVIPSDDEDYGTAEYTLNALRLVEEREEQDAIYNQDGLSRYGFIFRARSDDSGGWAEERVCCYLNEINKYRAAARIFIRFM